MGGRQAEIRRQASRTDAAAARIEERSEYVALNVSRAYIDYLLQQRLVAIADDNATFHERLAGDLREGVAKGSISIADQQQAEERLQSARARVTEAREDLDTAGDPVPDPGRHADRLACRCRPICRNACRRRWRRPKPRRAQNNPRVQESLADLSTARELIRRRKFGNGPACQSRGNRSRSATTSTASDGRTTDLLGRVVMRWLVFNGGTNINNVREQQARADEAHARVFEQTRRAEEDARSAWSRLTNQSRLVTELETQSRVADDLLLSYREQFNVGRRSLLDVLDAQNTRQNVQAQAETARMAKLYAQYRVLAASQPADRVPWRADAAGGLERRAGALPTSTRSRPRTCKRTALPQPVMGPPAPTGGR